jgi:hypothetical protein
MRRHLLALLLVAVLLAVAAMPGFFADQLQDRD